MTALPNLPRFRTSHTGSKELGLEPHPLTDDVLGGMFEIVEQFEGRIEEHKIFRGIKW